MSRRIPMEVLEKVILIIREQCHDANRPFLSDVTSYEKGFVVRHYNEWIGTVVLKIRGISYIVSVKNETFRVHDPISTENSRTRSKGQTFSRIQSF